MSDVKKQFKTEADFRKFLRKLVKAVWPSDAACSREMGVDQSLLHRYLAGERPAADLEKKLLKRLNIKVETASQINVISVNLFPGAAHPEDKVIF